MAEQGEEKLTPLEQGLLTALRSIDRQISREMQRTPSEKETQGVQKWEPYQKRIENICAFVINNLGDQDIGLDSVLVMAQAMAKSLQLIVEELAEEGLGKIRVDYCRAAFRGIQDSCRKGELVFQGPALS